MEYRLDYPSVSPKIYKAIKKLGDMTDDFSIDPALVALIKLRVSQLHKSPLCVDRHSATFLNFDGNKSRLNEVSDWQNSNLFSSSEKAALAWAEFLILTPANMADDIYAELLCRFSSTQAVDLTVIVNFVFMSNAFSVCFSRV